MTATHHGLSSAAGGRRFARRPLNPWVSLKTWSTRPSTDPCTPGQLLPMLRRVYWHFHRRPTPTQPRHSTSPVLWGAGVGPALDLACLWHGLRDSPKGKPLRCLLKPFMFWSLGLSGTSELFSPCIRNRNTQVHYRERTASFAWLWRALMAQA